MDALEKLVELFRQFPGIGPRQARRFAYFLLVRGPGFSRELATRARALEERVRSCELCFRFFETKQEGDSVCRTCSDRHRDGALLLVVAHDVDADAIEASGSYKGYYFILGGTVPIAEKNPEKKIRSAAFLAAVEQRAKHELKELILGMNATPDGEHTALHLRSILLPLVAKYALTISTLGRGLSTGTELEYSDTETLRSALTHRTH
ncbi:MAG: recombination protein RecR [Parcubacteria group bacterium Gr01-1014_72]|nr:MAG: recombination protein RecR [Parcubacteria group bacterium Gr01-1014_72]